jgi:hypothetical protein
MEFDRLSKPSEIVSPFKSGDHSASAWSRSKIQEHPGEIRKILVCEPELPERVANARIKPCGNQKQLRTVVIEGGEKPVAEGFQNFVSSRAG